MDRSYLWRASKTSRRVHILDSETGRTYCQVENCGGKAFDGKGAEVPAGRRLCRNCIDLTRREKADYREPSLAVLLGERIAETEPELAYEGGGKWSVDGSFGHASAVVSKPERTDLTSNRVPKLTRGEQAQPVNRSRGRKPKRSNVKHPRPFNDDLPW